MPKTQSALLEAMAEQQVTVDGETRRLDEPFLVMATQNPIEYEGTFPLPEAQLDRFFVKTTLGYPDAEDEAQIVEEQLGGHPLGRLEPVVDLDDVSTAPRAVARRVRARSGRALDRRPRPRDARARHRRDRQLRARHARPQPRGARLGGAAPAAATSRRRTSSSSSSPCSCTASSSVRASSPRSATAAGRRLPSSSARALPRASRRSRASTSTSTSRRRRATPRVSRLAMATGLPARPAPARDRPRLRRRAQRAPRHRLRRREHAPVPARATTSAGWTGRRPRSSPPRAATTSSSCASASPTRRRASSCSPTAGRRCRSARRRCARLDKPRALCSPRLDLIARERARGAQPHRLPRLRRRRAVSGVRRAASTAPSRARSNAPSTRRTTPSRAASSSSASTGATCRRRRSCSSSPTSSSRPTCTRWQRALEHRWELVPVVIQDPVWERTFPDVGGITIPYADPRAGRRRAGLPHARARPRACATSTRARWTELVRDFRSLGIEPVVRRLARARRACSARSCAGPTCARCGAGALA